MLGEDGDHFGVLIKGILLQDPISLQAQLDIPQCSEGISSGIVELIVEAVVEGEAPKLYKRSDELTLIALGADVC